MAEVAQSGVTKSWQANNDEYPVLFERYQLLGIIGEGGMGTVFKGYHINLKRPVAIKTLRIDQRQSLGMVSRFLKEMETVGQMDHPNVVRATDAGERNGVFYLVMEYLSGLDLARLVVQKGRLDCADACELTRQAALGLDYIHQTLVHRDIKPSNLMLTPTGLIKILDLGLARFRLRETSGGEKTPDGCAVGTYAYMAPEQAWSGANVDGRADIYSLGCTLFKLLTGHAPYGEPEFDNAAKVINAHCHVPLTKMARFQAIPEGLRDVLCKMMAKNVDERYRSGQEVADALGPFIAANAPVAVPLLAGLREAVNEAPVSPLPHPLPAEISRLTAAPNDTPRETLSAASTLDVRKPRRRGWRRGLWAVGVLAAGLAMSIGFYALAPLRDPAHDPPGAAGNARPGMRLLDELPPHKRLTLLDKSLLPVGHDVEDRRKWLWEPGEQLDVKGADFLCFPLGTTTRVRFKFEAGITQAPWSGRVGIFWGYHEDDALKKKKIPVQDFAWFQYLNIYTHTDPGNEIKHSVRRGKGSLRYNQRGEIASALFDFEHDPVRLTSGEAILQIEIDGNRLRNASLGPNRLDANCSDAANHIFRAESYQGAVGLFADYHTATFSNVSFVALSKN